MRNDEKTPVDGFTTGTSSRNIHFPIWQSAPIKDFSGAIMFDVYSEKNRRLAIDELLSTKQYIRLIIPCSGILLRGELFSKIL